MEYAVFETDETHVSVSHAVWLEDTPSDPSHEFDLYAEPIAAGARARYGVEYVRA